MEDAVLAAEADLASAARTLARRRARELFELFADGDGRIARIPGGHCAFFGEHKALADKYHKYLVSVGMCD